MCTVWSVLFGSPIIIITAIVFLPLVSAPIRSRLWQGRAPFLPHETGKSFRAF